MCRPDDFPPYLEDQPPVPGGTTAIRDGQYVTEERAPGPPSPSHPPEPATAAGRWLVDRSRWDSGMRGFFVRINQTGGPEDMLIHVLAIEREARNEP